MYNSAELMGILVKGMGEISTLKVPKEISGHIEKLISALTRSELAELFVYERMKNSFISKSDPSSVIDINKVRGVMGDTLAVMEPMIFNHIRSERKYLPKIDNPTDIKLRAQMIFPIADEAGEYIGLLRLSRTVSSDDNYNQKDITLLESVEPYLVKMIHILTNEKREVSVNEAKVQVQIEQLEKQSKQGNQQLDESMMFLSNTVHDIRTPANSLYGFLDLIEGQIEDKKILKFIQNAKQSAEFINTLIDSILERVKYQHEALASKPEPVNTASFFSSVGNIFSANMSTKEINYTIKIDPATPKEIKIEMVKLKRILINLIGNAYKFTPSGKSITLSVTYNKRDNRLLIEVDDTGLGIDKKRQQDIFKAFEQEKENTAMEHGGTGLGLAICAGYVDDLGGTLSLESELDFGSRFFFEIPVVAVDSSPTYALVHPDKKVVIYTDKPQCESAKHIKWFLLNVGLPESNVTISDTIYKTTTYIICFEHKLSAALIKATQQHHIQLILFEEKLFSLSRKKEYENYPILSKNNYFQDVLFGALYSEQKPNILIVDDSKLNVQLLESIFDGEHCEVTPRYNGEDGLKELIHGFDRGRPYDIVFTDKNMPDISGTQMLKRYREYQAKHNRKVPLYTVSITGDIDIDEEDRLYYNEMIQKPFKGQKILQVLERFNK